MLTRKALATLLIGAMGFTVLAAQAEEKVPAPAAKTKPIHGRQLMSREEHKEYAVRMRAAKTDEECDAVRAEHHKLMQERARNKGVELPKAKPSKGCGPHSTRRGMGGMGMGQGMKGQ